MTTQSLGTHRCFFHLGRSWQSLQLALHFVQVRECLRLAQQTFGFGEVRVGQLRQRLGQHRFGLRSAVQLTGRCEQTQGLLRLLPGLFRAHHLIHDRFGLFPVQAHLHSLTGHVLALLPMVIVFLLGFLCLGKRLLQA